MRSSKQNWLALALACFSCMNLLVQENPVVIERLERSSSLRRDSFETIWQWLSFTSQTKGKFAGSTATNQEVLDVTDLQEQVSSLWRCLMEDNPAVVRPWFEQENSMAQVALKGAWDLVRHHDQTDAAESIIASNGISDLASLHLVGVLLAAVMQLPSFLQQQNEHGLSGLPLLKNLNSFLILPDVADANMTQRRKVLLETFQKAQDQEKDSNLEWAVVRQQHVKKEPARAIARRLKQRQQRDHALNPLATDEFIVDSKIVDGAIVENDEDKEENSMDVDVKRGTLMKNRTDYLEEWQTELNLWRREHVALELALEITANLTNNLMEGEGLHQEDNDTEMMQLEGNPLNDDIRSFFSDFQRMQQLLSQFTQQLVLQPAWPPVIMQHLMDLQGKAAVCLAHILATTAVRDNRNNDIEQNMDALVALWRDLVVAFEQQPDVAGTMVVALQSHQGLSIQAVRPTDVDLFLSHLSTLSPSTKDRSDEVTSYTDTVTLLGIILCDQAHTREMNVKVCQALLKAGYLAAGISKDTKESATASSIPVMAETLNVLIDIYGDDDRHPDVFEELNVLAYFQRTLPILKQNIQIVRDGEMSLEYTKEIALNASRFIQYKKGHIGN